MKHTYVNMYTYAAAVLLIVYVGGVNAQYEDVRCKCVCQPIQPENHTEPLKRRVFVKSFSDHEMCLCENVVDKATQDTTTKYCDRCQCEWQRRNTTTIKVVVMMIICVTGLLFLYMLFLLCLDPLMSRRPKTYEEQRNEEVNLDTQSIHRGDQPATTSSDGQPRPRALISRVKHEVDKVRGEQQKWKGQVQEQRRHIYQAHTMLN